MEFDFVFRCKNTSWPRNPDKYKIWIDDANIVQVCMIRFWKGKDTKAFSPW